MLVALSDLLNVRKQLAFYGAYHSNKVNVAIHIVFVPIILWTVDVFLGSLPFPWQLKIKFNDYAALELNLASLHALLAVTYYFALEPLAALLYVPQLLLSLTTATAFAKRQDSFVVAVPLFIISWVVQFFGHGLAEKNSPALLDNIIGALLLAPFFVHLEILFKLGFKRKLYKEIQNDVGVEIAKIRKAAGDERRKMAE